MDVLLRMVEGVVIPIIALLIQRTRKESKEQSDVVASYLENVGDQVNILEGTLNRRFDRVDVRLDSHARAISKVKAEQQRVADDLVKVRLERK